jgi:hypothetical protein
LTAQELKDIASAVQSFATVLSLAVGGSWVYWKFIRQRENQPNIDFTAEIKFIGQQAGWWIVELVAVVTNKGKVLHRLEKFEFDLNALGPDDPVELRAEWGNQVHFPALVAKGSFLPVGSKYFFIDPGGTARYSHVTRVSTTATFVIFHTWFQYPNDTKLHHSAEATALVPRDQAPQMALDTARPDAELIRRTCSCSVNGDTIV